MISEGCSIEELLTSGCSELKGFLIFADATFYMRATVGDESLLDPFPALKDAVNARLLPVETLKRINSDRFIRLPRKKTYIENLTDLGVVAPTTNVFSGGKHQGWLVSVRPDNEFTQGDFDIQDQLAELVGLWLEKSRSHEARLEKSGIFTEILAGNAFDSAVVYRRLEAFGWRAADKKQIYAFEPVKGHEHQAFILESHLGHLHEGSFVGHFGTGLYYLVNKTLVEDEQDFKRSIESLVSSCGYRAGASPVFADISRLGEYYRASLAAARVAQPGCVAAFSQAVIPLAADVLSASVLGLVEHPALESLDAYDRRYGTSLCDTLNTFVKMRCNYTSTAKELYVHRSTLTYRIQKITELTGIDFDNFDEQFSLEVAFLLREARSERE